MTETKNKVIHLHQRDPEAALERLNRITGLQFARWPESLVPQVDEAPEADSAVDTISLSSAR
ncbi:hypothetical protein [Pseudomonas sp.]|uniref:hypothetical protein n=1 Tax=Pseudomonas sp. TaxID=306 RepID=UPI003D110DF2